MMQDGKHVILYVDDDPDFRDSLRQILEANGYIMVEASSADEGLRVYESTRPDFILVDLMMEEIDAGTNLVTELRAAGNTSPVYMLSSVGDSMSRMTSPAELGLAGVFQKPIDHKRLLSVLQSQLRQPAS